MIKRFAKQTSVIGMDIGPFSIKAAQVTVTGKGPRLDGALSLRRSGGGTLSDHEGRRLSRALMRRGMCARHVALIASAESLVSTSLTLPAADADVARDPIVKTELSRAHRMHPDTFEYAWWDLPAGVTGNRGGQAHAVALPHAAVASTLDTLDRLRLETVQTVPASVAMLAAAQRRPIDPRRIVAVLDLGSEGSHLVLMHAGCVVHERALPEFNTNAIRDALAESLSIDSKQSREALGAFGVRDEPDGMVACATASVLGDALEELSEQVGMSFAFISHLYPEAELGPLLLTGGAANIPGLPRVLWRELEMETAPMVPTMLVTEAVFGDEMNDPALTTALGAALYAGGA